MQETQETQVQSLAQEDRLEEGMAAHSCILAWEIPRTEEPGGLQFMDLQRVGHHRVTKQAEKQAGLNIRSPRTEGREEKIESITYSSSSMTWCHPGSPGSEDHLSSPSRSPFHPLRSLNT